ncbi:MAG: hypothetical protein PVG27_07440 [Chloroflexota bacterium]|jgi:hypothetical protein
MILLGCLLAFSIALAPRLVLILAWIFSDRWPVVWQGEWIWPLLGIIFLPYTTVMYLLAWSPAVAGGGNIEGWDWLWIILGLILDIAKWGQILANRQEATTQVQRYYPSGAPRYGGSGGTQAAISTGQVPPSTSPTAADRDTAPTATTTPPDTPKEDKPGG